MGGGGGSYLQAPMESFDESCEQEQQIQGKKTRKLTFMQLSGLILLLEGTQMLQYKIGQTFGCSQQEFCLREEQ